MSRSYEQRFFYFSLAIFLGLIASSCSSPPPPPKYVVTGEVSLTLDSGIVIKPYPVWVHVFPADKLRPIVQKLDELDHKTGNKLFGWDIHFEHDYTVADRQGSFSFNLLPGAYGLITKAMPVEWAEGELSGQFYAKLGGKPTYYWLVWFEVSEGSQNVIALSNINALPITGSDSLKSYIDQQANVYRTNPDPSPIEHPLTSAGSSGGEAYRVAQRVSAQLDVTTASEMLEQIPVGPSSQERIGSRRKITWTFSDGSQIVATFKPLGGEGSNLGLVLYTVEIK